MLLRSVASDTQVMDILKQVIQAMWVDEDSLMALPGCDASTVQRLNKSSITSLLQLLRMEPQRALGALQSALKDAGTRDSAVKVAVLGRSMRLQASLGLELVLMGVRDTLHTSQRMALV